VENEILLINIGSLASGGRVIGVKKDAAKIQLYKPVCAEICDKIAISRRIQGHYRLIGWGEIRKGKEIETQSYIETPASD
jgi:translation initiation factor 2 subunit 3